MPPPVTLTALTGTQFDAASASADVMTLDAEVVSDVTALIGDLVASGVALGWVERPSSDGLDVLQRNVTDESQHRMRRRSWPTGVGS